METLLALIVILLVVGVGCATSSTVRSMERGPGRFSITPRFAKQNARLIKRFTGPSRDPVVDGIKAIAAKLWRLGSKAAMP